MLQISDEACEVLFGRLQKELEGRPELRRRQIPPALKLFFRKNSAHLGLGFPGNGDEVVNYHGRTVLIISAEDLAQLADACFLVRHNGGDEYLSLERQRN